MSVITKSTYSKLSNLTVPDPVYPLSFFSSGKFDNSYQPTPISPSNNHSQSSVYREGGSWLSAARSFIQCRYHNGDRVQWSSHDELPNTSVLDIEEAAAKAVASDRNDRAMKNKDSVTLFPAHHEIPISSCPHGFFMIDGRLGLKDKHGRCSVDGNDWNWHYNADALVVPLRY